MQASSTKSMPLCRRPLQGCQAFIPVLHARPAHTPPPPLQRHANAGLQAVQTNVIAASAIAARLPWYQEKRGSAFAACPLHVPHNLLATLPGVNDHLRPRNMRTRCACQQAAINPAYTLPCHWALKPACLLQGAASASAHQKPGQLL